MSHIIGVYFWRIPKHSRGLMCPNPTSGSRQLAHIYVSGVYPANHDARARVTKFESVH
jgi:hypothetical protein